MKDKCLQNTPKKISESTWNTCGCTDHASKLRLANRVAECKIYTTSSNKMLKNFGKCNLNSTHTKSPKIERGHSIMEGFV